MEDNFTTQPSQENLQPVSPVPSSSVPNPPMPRKFPFKILLGLLIVLFLAGSAAGYYFYSVRNSKPQQKLCTQEAKLCPDGSSVGRTGPNCEFTPCPTPDMAGWKTYINEGFGFSLKYPISSTVEFTKGTPIQPDHLTISLSMISTKDVAEKNLVILFQKTNRTVTEEVDEMIKQHDLGKTSTSTISRSSISVDGSNFEQLITTYKDSGIRKLQVFGNKNGILYQFQINTAAQNEKSTRTILELILSTFKFTN